MAGQTAHFTSLLKRLGILLFLYSVCRVAFYTANANLFPDIPLRQWPFILASGLRFDLSAVIYTNLLFIVGHIIPGPWRDMSWFKGLLKTLFYLTNGLALALTVGDFGWFPFTMRRATADITGMAGEFLDLLPVYLVDFWYLPAFFILLIITAEWLYRKTGPRPAAVKYTRQLPLMTAGIILSVIGARGGFQLIPISPITAARHMPVALSPIVLNTPFTFIYSLEHKGVLPKNYFTPEELDAVYNPVRHETADSASNRSNVVILIMESFSKEYSGFLSGGETYTPFLDSLMQHSLVCTNAYANGKHSNEGLVAITASIPGLMDEALINSQYQNNTVMGIGAILGQAGYQTAFFHGGKNGTFGFDHFSLSAGFSEYFGMNEYANPSDFDGFWGIYDKPFLEYFAGKLNGFSEPFLAVCFSLSSHHPYNIPESDRKNFRAGTLPIHQSIRYADHALENFFRRVSGMPWYSGTLFVIVADHTGPAERDLYYTSAGIYSIPIVFFKPGGELKGRIDAPVQQTDVMPSVIDYLGLGCSYIAYGSSLFGDSPKAAFNYSNGIYQIIMDGMVLQFDGSKPVALFDHAVDPLMKNNMLPAMDAEAAPLEQYLKGVIQSFHNRLIHNTLIP